MAAVLPILPKQSAAFNSKAAHQNSSSNIVHPAPAAVRYLSFSEKNKKNKVKFANRVKNYNKSKNIIKR